MTLNFSLLISICLLVSWNSACHSSTRNDDKYLTSKTGEVNTNGAVNSPAPNGETSMSNSSVPSASDSNFTMSAPTKNDCASAKLAGKAVDKKQTFPIDFEPFEKSCFVTFYEPEFADPPLGEKIFIYKDGEQIFEFPDQSEAPNFTIRAVAFEDLNADGLVDIIIASSTGEKGGTIYSGQVYVNNSDGFTTNANANYELDNLKTIREIANFVRKNKQLFFK